MTEIRPGLEGVAIGTTEITCADPAGGMLRYRGVAVDELARSKPSFDAVWRLLVTDRHDVSLLADVSTDDLPTSAPTTGDGRTDLQRMVLGLGTAWAQRPLTELDESACVGELARSTVAIAITLGDLLRAVTGAGPVGDEHVRTGTSTCERLVLAWTGDASRTEVEALDCVLTLIADHGSSASAFAARVAASAGATTSACLASALSTFSGVRHGGASTASLGALLDLQGSGQSVERWVQGQLDRGRRLPGIGHRTYRTADPRLPLLKELSAQLDAPLHELAMGYEAAATQALAHKGAQRVLPANVDLWIPVVLDALGVPARLVSAVLSLGRTAGWSAHIAEEHRSRGRLIRPSDVYVGHPHRTYEQVTT